MTGGTLDLDGNNQQIFRLVGSDNATAGTGTITSSSPATFTVGNNLSGRPSIFDGSLTPAAPTPSPSAGRAATPARPPSAAACCGSTARSATRR